jgi:membrane protease subunit HflC
MKNIGIPILVAILVLLMGLMLVTFQVRETELAFVTRFGDPVRTQDTPGLYFKWPTPIEKTHKYDARMRVFEADTGETTTKGAVPIIVKTYVVWRIANAEEFYKSVKTVEQAKSTLYSQISDTQNRIIGGYAFSEFVNSDPAKIKIVQIQQEMLNDLKGAIESVYGITIETLGIKQLKVNEAVTEKVFERMRAARNLKTEATIAEGEAEATKITTDAVSISQELMAAANARAKAIQGRGDAEAARYLEMLKEAPQFAIFLKNIDALKTMFKAGTTVVLPMDAEPMSLLKEVPDPNTWNQAN